MSQIVIPLNSYSQTEITFEEYDMYFQRIRESGAYGVEIRRELLSPQSAVLDWIGERLATGLFIVYSVPLPLWKNDGSFNEEALEMIYEETRQVKAKWLKLSLGNYQEDVSDLTRVKDFLNRQGKKDRHIQLLVENDQTEFGGQIVRFAQFFEQVEKRELPIKMTFDIGNWIYTGLDPNEAWAVLSAHVVYLHLKEVITNDAGQLETIPLSTKAHSAWQTFVTGASNECLIALEFPINPLQKTTKDFVEMVKEVKGELAWNK